MGRESGSRAVVATLRESTCVVGVSTAVGNLAVKSAERIGGTVAVAGVHDAAVDGIDGSRVDEAV